MQYLLATKSIDNIAGAFNYHLLKLLSNKFLDIFTAHFEMVNKLTHISGSLIDHVYITRTLMKLFFTHATVENIFLSGHDIVRYVIQKNTVDFHTFP